MYVLYNVYRNTYTHLSGDLAPCDPIVMLRYDTFNYDVFVVTALKHNFYCIPPDNLLLDSAPNIGPLISSRELDKFRNC
jgi:hypothetical protein